LKVFGSAALHPHATTTNSLFGKPAIFTTLSLDFPSDLAFNALSNRLHLFLGMFFLIFQGRTPRRKYKQRPSSCSDLLVELAVVFGV